MGPASAVKYVVSELKDNYDDPLWWRGRLAQRLVAPVHRAYYGNDGVDVMSEDWDNLLVLDGCRADLFEEVVGRSPFDNYQRATSRASMTREWTAINFEDGQYGDTVYVTANPYVSRLAGASFHDVIPVWKDNFDDEVGTVRPEPVVEAIQDARREYPEKRLVGHFMQPHYPFLDHPALTFDSWDPDHMDDTDGGHGGDGPHNVWQALELGLVDRETVWDAYADNLRQVVEAIQPLVGDLDGRTIVTSDHGNMLGERAWPVPLRIYGHPPGLRASELVEVPWAVREGERRTVTDEGTVEANVMTDEVSERLRDLGYA